MSISSLGRIYGSLPLDRRRLSPILLLLLCACTSTKAQTVPIPTLTPTLLPTWTPFPTLTPTSMPTIASELACPDPDNLWPGQHISAGGSYTETQTQAAGAMVCQIERDSCAYHYLVGDLNPMIVFKGEEAPPYNEEDILMHPNMVLPLSRLSQLVLAEWGGAVQLRVTDAYDSLLEHDLDQSDQNRRVSLHFEGRAVDLTTWPIDQARYPRLCALAHCAGFAWVHNEESHCHAAIKAESLCTRCK